MTGKKRRRSDAGPPAPEDAYPQKAAIHHTERSHPSGAPPEPGPGADTYYRNLYATPPDFMQLGKQDPAFGAVCDCTLLFCERSQQLTRFAASRMASPTSTTPTP
ncbi:hypothetical protein CSOJ01_10418 [Colletotrichum sojae]|uniref:Uncharacterized protein n=1 Tax=Colletotrichum sojae TaxID=2175907 RepID=A0A8H6MPH5_9PEZI|nr:hypothetical protein CSOJ01_10418 [Colletotrichum sojae]